MSRLRKRDLATAIEAVQEAGCEIARVEIETDGRIVVVTGNPLGPAAPTNDLDRELQDFEVKHAR